MNLWYPDFCPGGQCVILENADATKIGFVSACAHHQNLRTLHGDVGAFEAIAASCQAREKARYAVKQALGLPKDHPGVPYRVEPNGDFAILSGARGQTLSTLRTLVSAEVSAFSTVPGTSQVTVE